MFGGRIWCKVRDEEWVEGVDRGKGKGVNRRCMVRRWRSGSRKIATAYETRFINGNSIERCPNASRRAVVGARLAVSVREPISPNPHHHCFHCLTPTPVFTAFPDLARRLRRKKVTAVSRLLVAASGKLQREQHQKHTFIGVHSLVLTESRVTGQAPAPQQCIS